jgi:hypothetical protein
MHEGVQKAEDSIFVRQPRNMRDWRCMGVGAGDEDGFRREPADLRKPGAQRHDVRGVHRHQVEGDDGDAPRAVVGEEDARMQRPLHPASGNRLWAAGQHVAKVWGDITLPETHA